MSEQPFALSSAFGPAFATGLALLALLFFCQSVIYPLLLSSLRHVPGPKLGAITSLYMDSRYYFDTAIPFIKSLHQKYGPVVRVGPNEIVTSDASHLALIYGPRSTFRKPDTAVLNHNHGHPNTFSSITREEHKQTRRQVAKVYTASSILKNETLTAWIQDRLNTTSKIIERSKSAPVDIFAIAGYFALDVVSQLVYGRSFNLLEGNNLHIADHIRVASSISVPVVRFSWLVRYLGVWPLTHFLPNIFTRGAVTAASLEAANEEQIEAVKNAEDRTDSETTAVGCMENQPSYGKSLTDGHVKSECLDHVVAGADTTAASMTYVLYTLARQENHKYQDRLREEVSKLATPLDFKEVCNLPFLDICVLECLRLYPPGPGGLQQRVTPAGENTVLVSHGKKYSLPPNTLVGIQAYTLQRNESIYGARPGEFLPERWETASETQLKTMKEAWIVFGTGARTCIGINLALIELKSMIATILRKYTVELPSDWDPADMEPVFAAVIRPQAEKCELVFRSISN